MADRSWMAAALLIAGVATPAVAQDAPTPPTPVRAPAPARPAAPDPSNDSPTHVVRMQLEIAGLGTKGCDVVIRPAHPACSFKPVTTHVGREGKAMLSFADVKTRSGDRDCTFAITIREPGHPERTIHRGLRLAAKPGGNPSAPQVLTCFLTSPSEIARTTGDGTTTRR